MCRAHGGCRGSGNTTTARQAEPRAGSTRASGAPGGLHQIGCSMRPECGIASDAALLRGGKGGGGGWRRMQHCLCVGTNKRAGVGARRPLSSPPPPWPGNIIFRFLRGGACFANGTRTEPHAPGFRAEISVKVSIKYRGETSLIATPTKFFNK